jgi:alkylhydroperoxidase family enzyme
MAIDSPKPTVDQPVDEGSAEAFLPYPPIGDKLEHVPIHVRPELHYYISRMGFLPNTLKLYLHTPWIAECLFRLNNAVMRDERNSLSEHLMYRLGAIASRDNECTYCTAHHALTLTRRWGYEADQVESLLQLDDESDEREAAAIRFVHQASLDPSGVTDEMREDLTRHFSPPEVMQIVCLMGFWKMYNAMHTAMAAPLEDPVLDHSDWVKVQPKAA